MAAVINHSKNNFMTFLKKMDTFLYKFGNKIL